MKNIRYVLTVRMESHRPVAENDVEDLVCGAAGNMERYVAAVAASEGLDRIELLEGHMYVNGEERRLVKGGEG